MSSVQHYQEPWNLTLVRPSQILDQRFAVALESADLETPLVYPLSILSVGKAPNYVRSWRSFSARKDYGSSVTLNKNKYQVTLDVQQFAPNEVTVKVVGRNIVVVEGKHEEKEDHHGSVSRHFVRKYVLPNGLDIDNVVSSLSSDGVLTVSVPQVGTSSEEQRSVPILQTGVPVSSGSVVSAKPKVAEEKPEKEEAAADEKKD